MKIKLILSYKTEVGTFYIGQSEDGRFHPIYDNEDYGSYYKIWQAVEDIANDCVGSILHPETGDLLDICEYEIPEDPSEWERIC